MGIAFVIDGIEYDGEGWKINPPSKGDEFELLMLHGKPCPPECVYNGHREMWVVDRVIYNPYFNRDGHFDFTFTDCKVYLIPKPKTKPVQTKNID